MFVLGISTLSTANSEGTRLVLLFLLLLAVILILAGCVIALLTLRKQRNAHSSHINPVRMESKRT